MTTPADASPFDRALPAAADAERALLGCMLLDEAAVAEAITHLRGIGGRAFFNQRHARLFDAICQLADAGGTVDAIVLKDHLRQTGVLDEVGGLDFLGELVSTVATPQRVNHYARLVRDKYLLRQLIRAAHNVQDLAFNDDRPVEEVFDEAERAMFAIAEQRVGDAASDLHTLVQQALEQLRKREGGVTSGVPTGYFGLDELTCGLQPAELIIVAGRPSMGKTAFALNIAEHVALTERRPVLFFSLEMSKQQLAQRILCSRARVDAHKLRRNMLGPADLRRLEAACDEAQSAPLYVDDTADLSILEMRARARLAYRRYKFHLVFVDYLQLMRGPRSESRQVEVAEISRGLKALAKDLNVPVVALAQLNRGPEDRASNVPRMSDLRESGALEQDADVIMLLHREAYYRRQAGDLTADDDTSAEIIIAKQRNGPVDTVKLHFNKQWTRFDNAATDHDSAPPAPMRDDDQFP